MEACLLSSPTAWLDSSPINDLSLLFASLNDPTMSDCSFLVDSLDESLSLYCLEQMLILLQYLIKFEKIFY